MGNNMLISRKAYLELGGFDSIGYSIVEDCSLLSAFRKKRLRTAPVEPFFSTATTAAAHDIGDYHQQLMRWASGGFRGNPSLFMLWLLLSFQNVLFVLSFIAPLPVTALFLTYGNFLLTWIFIFAAFNRTKSSCNALLWAPYYPVLLVQSLVVMAALVSARPIVWKGRRI